MRQSIAQNKSDRVADRPAHNRGTLIKTLVSKWLSANLYQSGTSKSTKKTENVNGVLYETRRHFTEAHSDGDYGLDYHDGVVRFCNGPGVQRNVCVSHK